MQIAIPLFDDLTALDAIGPYEVLSRLPGAEVASSARKPDPTSATTECCACTPTRRSTPSLRRTSCVFPAA